MQFSWLLPVSIILACGQEPAVDSPAGRQGAQNEPLRRELMTMLREDQSARESMLKRLGAAGVRLGSSQAKSDPAAMKTLQDEMEKLKTVDDRHRTRLQKIIEQHGWPGKSLVGANAAHAAWLIVQHADGDRALQKRCLHLMETAPKGEVDGTDIAYLTDRVLVGEKKPQRYGTQTNMDFKPYPIEDEKNVDKRRAGLGLPPLAEYLRLTKELYEKQQNQGADAAKK
jgi:hypothetical protein